MKNQKFVLILLLMTGIAYQNCNNQVGFGTTTSSSGFSQKVSSYYTVTGCDVMGLPYQHLDNVSKQQCADACKTNFLQVPTQNRGGFVCEYYENSYKDNKYTQLNRWQFFNSAQQGSTQPLTGYPKSNIECQTAPGYAEVGCRQSTYRSMTLSYEQALQLNANSNFYDFP